MIKIKAKPSIPKIQLIFIEENQLLTSRNWKKETVGSKKKSKPQHAFNIINDQNNPKFRIKTCWVLSTKHKKKHATKGIRIIVVNIILFFRPCHFKRLINLFHFNRSSLETELFCSVLKKARFIQLCEIVYHNFLFLYRVRKKIKQHETQIWESNSHDNQFCEKTKTK